MGEPVRQREGVVGELDQVRLAAHCLELARRLQVLGEGDMVDGHIPGMQIHHAGEDQLMGTAEEALGAQLDRHLVDGVPIQHACCTHRFLGLDILGHLLERLGMRRSRFVCVIVRHRSTLQSHRTAGNTPAGCGFAGL